MVEKGYIIAGVILIIAFIILILYFTGVIGGTNDSSSSSTSTDTKTSTTTSPSTPTTSPSTPTTPNSTTTTPNSTTTTPNSTTTTPSTSESTPTYVTARYVKLLKDVSGGDNLLNITEIEVYDISGKKIVIPASRASITSGFVDASGNIDVRYKAEKLVDGNLDFNTNFAHTRQRGPTTVATTTWPPLGTPVSMELDLGKDIEISQIVIINRGGSDQVLNRIRRARLILIDSLGNTTYESPEINIGAAKYVYDNFSTGSLPKVFGYIKFDCDGWSGSRQGWYNVDGKLKFCRYVGDVPNINFACIETDGNKVITQYQMNALDPNGKNCLPGGPEGTIIPCKSKCDLKRLDGNGNVLA